MTFATGETAGATLSSYGVHPTRYDVPRSREAGHTRSDGFDVPRARDAGHTLSDDSRSVPFHLVFANGERIQGSLYGSLSEPTSLWRALARLHRLSQLPHGWDSYGAQPLSASAVRRCINFLPSLLPDDALSPSIVPTRDGGIQFEWHHRGIDLEIKFPPAGPISYAFADEGTGEDREWTGAFDREAVRDAFARMTVAG